MSISGRTGSPSVASQQRHTITPSKIVEWARSGGSEHSSRNATPQRAVSATRCGSAVNDALLRQRAQSQQLSRPRHPSRSDSRRRQRRWENKHLISMVEYYANQGEERLMEALDPSSETAEELAHALRYNTLSELLKPCNREQLHAFLSCQRVTPEFASRKAGGSSLRRDYVDQLRDLTRRVQYSTTPSTPSAPTTQSNAIPTGHKIRGSMAESTKLGSGGSAGALQSRIAALEHFMHAEQRWLNLEKKTRSALLRAATLCDDRHDDDSSSNSSSSEVTPGEGVGSGSENGRGKREGGFALALLSDIEACIRLFMRTGQLLDVQTTSSIAPQLGDLRTGSAVGKALADALSGPLTLDKRGSLVIPLRDSAFYRLLLHAAAKFHGVQSKVHAARYYLFVFLPFPCSDSWVTLICIVLPIIDGTIIEFLTVLLL